MRQFIILLLGTCFLAWIPGIGNANGRDGFIRNTGNTPQLCFVENKGQVIDQDGISRSDIDFRLSTGNGLNIFAGSGQLHYQWAIPRAATGMNTSPVRKDRNDGVITDLYRMDVVLVGANRQARMIAENGQSYYEQYFLPQHGEKGVRAYAWKKVVYKDVYPHIDWILYLNEAGKLEYDFIVHPGGRVSDIQLRYEGAVSMQINNDGGLTATTPFGIITEQAPYSFQANGAEVKSRFVLKGNDLFFATDAYQGVLTIDPTLEWATYCGGTGGDESRFVTTDEYGNVYIAGYMQSANMATTGSHQQTLGGGRDAFLAKINNQGQRIWATYYGETAADVAYGVVYDPFAGTLYLVGQTGSGSGISTPNSHQQVFAGGGADAFLVKFDSAGVRQWATYYGANGWDDALSVSCDAVGNIYMSGFTESPTHANIATVGSH